MSFKYLIKLSLRTFVRRPMRTFLTILAMGVGIAAILIFVSFGFGLQKTMLEQITTEEALLSLDVSSPDLEVLPLDENTINQILRIENVEEVSPMAVLSGEISLGKLVSNTNLNACSASYLKLSGIVPEHGRIFEKKNEVIVSSALVKAFGLKDEKEVLKKKVKIKVYLKEKEGEIEILPLKETFLISGVIMDDTIDDTYDLTNVSDTDELDIEVTNDDELLLEVINGDKANEHKIQVQIAIEEVIE